MKKIDMSEKAVELRLRQVDQLHALSVELLKVGLAHHQKLVKEGRATEKQLKRFTKHFA